MEGDEIVAEPPNFITVTLSQGFVFLQTYGWFVVIIGALVYYAWYRARDNLASYVEGIKVGQQKKKDDGEIVRMQLAREERLRKLQEEHDANALIQAAKEAEFEEKKRQEKIEQWELHQRGLGYHSKIRTKEDETPTGSALPKTGGKKKLRGDDYNPLTGGEGSGWRRERPRPAAGGG